MNIRLNERDNTFTLMPVTDEEKMAIAWMAQNMSRGDRLHHAGRERFDSDKFVNVHWNLGGKQVEVVEKSPESTVYSSKYEGGVKFILRGTREEDKYHCNRIGDTGYFFSGGFVFLKVTDVDGVKSVVITAKLCHCGAPMIGVAALKRKICDACHSQPQFSPPR